MKSIDFKIECWDTLTLNDEEYDKVKKLIDSGKPYDRFTILDLLDRDDFEINYDTIHHLDPSENDGQATIELIDGENHINVNGEQNERY
jgi:hypothetical protein